VIRLTGDAESGTLNYMSRLIFAALAGVFMARAAAAQQVPGRDLLEFPLGVLADAPPLSTQMIGGLWNPAAAVLSPGRNSGFGFAGRTTPQELGVRLDMVGGAYRATQSIVTSLSFAQASVADILKTETDPTSLGGEISYGTTVVSAGLATSYKTATGGVSLRYRWGNVGGDHSSAFATDVGASLDSIAHTPVRIAVSTFLLSPNGTADASFLAAADVPVFRRDSTAMIRVGMSEMKTTGRGDERYAFATGKYRQIDLSCGVATVHEFGNSSRRWRLGLGVHRAGYTVAIGREDGGAGFGGSYQFVLTRALK
jgi:hypothetical protein